LFFSKAQFFSQVSNYAFSTVQTTYTLISGGLVLGTETTDDQRFVDDALLAGGFVVTGPGLPLGFTFEFNGNSYNRLAVNANGWISLGNSSLTPAVDNGSSSSYTPINSVAVNNPTTSRNRIAGFARDLQAQAGAELRLETIGTAPNRVCVVQWTNYKKFGTGGNGDNFNFQIRLNETSNAVEVVYGTMTNNATANTPQVGLGGSVAADFNNRTTPTDWLNSVAGLVNTATCNISTAIFPSSGTTYRWAGPPPTPPTPIQAAGIPSCASGTTIELIGTPDLNVAWYWQTTANGTSMLNPASAPWAIGANGTYFARAYSSITLAWSVSSSSITVTNFPTTLTPPAPAAAQNPACLPGTEVTMSTPPVGTDYYWQTIPNGTSTATPADPLFVSTNSTVYVAALETATQCWSVTNSVVISINSLVPFDPTASISSYSICSGATTQPISASAISMIPGSLQAAPTSNNGCGGGAMINISSNAMPITITGFDVRSQAAGNQNVVVWWKPNTYTDALNNQSAWTQLGTYPITAPAAQSLVFIDLDDLLIPANTTIGLYLQYNSAYFNTTGTVTYTNPDMTIAAGHGHCTAFSAGIVNRAFSGTVYYNAGMNSSLLWYDAQTGGNQIGAGSPFETVGSTLISNPATTPGDYTFYATASAGGCESINRLPITVTVSNVGAQIIPINVSCNGGANGSFSLGSVDCGLQPFTYSLDGGAFGAIPVNLTAGIHEIVIKDADELESGVYQITITEPGPIDNLVATVTGPTSVELTWTTSGDEIQWNIEYGPVGFTLGTGTELESLNIPTDVLDLTPNTSYHFYVQSGCGPNGEWVGPKLASTPQIPVSLFPWNEGFETGGAQWSLLNGSVANQWVVGTAVSAGGTQSLYVSDNAGVTNTYNGTSFSVAHAYRDIAFPATPGEVQLSFQWKNQGEGSFDYLQVWLVPSSFIPVAGNTFAQQITALAGPVETARINLTGNLNLQSSWQTWQGIIPANYYGETARLVFQWRNDGSVTNQPPAAVDNVSILVGECLRPNPVIVADVTQNSALVSWTEGSVGDDSWIIEYGPQGFQLGTGTQITVTENPYLLENLDNSTFYTLYVLTACDPSGTSIYSILVNFQTQFGCGGTFQDDGGLSGAYLANQNKVYTICPDSPTDYVEMIFDAFETQVNFDGFYIYYGDAIDIANIIPSGNAAGFAPLFAPDAWWGNQLVGEMLESLGAGECLTFQFLSNASTQLAGWEASIGCYPCIPESGVDGEVDVCRLDGTIDLNTVVTLNSDRGFWTLPFNPSLVTESTLNVLALPEGTYEAYYIVNTPCVSDTTVAILNIYPPSSAGQSGALVNCNNGIISLYEGLLGAIDLGGEWFTPGGQPLASNLVSVNNQLSGVYNYYYVASNGIYPADTSFAEVTLLNCVGLVENEIVGFELYPNPTTDLVTLTYSGESVKTVVYLVDAKGSVISVEEKLFETNDVFEIKMTELQAGSYFVTIVSDSGKTIIPVVKE